MYKYLTEVMHYLQYKILAGLIALVFSNEFFMLLVAFVALELLDILTRWLAQSKACYRALYPQSPCGLWQCMKWLWQSHKWRFINSAEWRNGFCDKMLLYLILLLTAAVADSIFSLGSAPRVITTIVVTVCGSTEALSVIENLSEATDNNVIVTIKNKIKSKFEVI